VTRVFALLLVVSLLSFGSKIDKKIDQSKSSLKSAEKQKLMMNQQLARIASSIKRTEKESARIDRILDKLNVEKSKNSQKYEKSKKKIGLLESKLKSLDSSIKIKHDRYVKLLADQFSVIVAMKSMNRKSTETVVMEEAYKAFRKMNEKELSRLKSELDKSMRYKKKITSEKEKLLSSIGSIEKKRRLYRQKKKEQQKLLKKLAREEDIYRKKLKSLITRQNMLRLTLAKLNILRKEEIEEAKRREAERQAEIRRQAKKLAAMRKAKAAERAKAIKEGKKADYSTVTLEHSDTKVKRYGTSYHKNRIYNYRGPKTISPVAGARVTKKFGTYVDPIYKIKIFNESITLTSPVPNQKVRNVLNGKVVFVGQNSMLGKVVIVSHSGKMHTVYAGLSRISPLIKNGSRIKKGTVIGKIKKKLIFEATKDSKYINPLRLIRL
jgi:septal ring factor EnvC (AmiA/AmiB activator)